VIRYGWRCGNRHRHLADRPDTRGLSIVAETPAEVREAARRALALDEATLLSECREEFLVAGGPGGQHRNKAATGVRLLHRPTGLVVTATERRSQLQNRGAALERLRRRLQAASHVPRPRRPTKPTRGAKERRLAAKKRRGQRKAMRRGAFD
jgi:ribosome-associated protein